MRKGVNMSSLKTKLEKHFYDNEKRRLSLKEREKAKLNQTQIIKQALSSHTFLSNASKKITFSDEDDDFKSSDNRKSSNGRKKSILFDNSESSESEDFVIKEKIHFGGKKGFELLNLQSTYGNDERFKINEKFLEDESENLVKDRGEISDPEVNVGAEKTRQLKILENILGTSLKPGKEKKMKPKVHEMIRYDASNKDHEIYEIKTQSNISKLLPKKRKLENKEVKTDIDNSNKPKVSKEKFYKISSEIKNQLKKKENDPFSVLGTYCVNGEATFLSETEEISESNCDGIIVENDNEIQLNSDELKEEDKEIQLQKANEKGFVAKGISKESFFFDQDDVRFKDALEFINKKNSSEAMEAVENYEKTRKKLKEILRLHLKKQLHKKNPFKNKIGGMNKKQLANSKFKNSKMMLSKINQSKKSFAEEI